MKIKTSDLVGLTLDLAVAKALGSTRYWFDTIQTHWVELDGKDLALNGGWAESMMFKPSTSGSAGEEIMDRERISTRTYAKPGHNWVAFIDLGGSSVSGAKARQVGSTRRIAAMRCFVASRLGDEVEVPDELCAVPA